jgi:hypothetical protein
MEEFIQQELFKIKSDYRLQQLRMFIRDEVVNQCWFPSAKQLVEIGDKFKVISAIPLRILEEEIELFLKNVENKDYDEEFDDEDKDKKLVKFYKNKLKKNNKEL